MGDLMCSNTMLKERELQRKQGINHRAHLLVITFFARWQQHLGTGKEGVHRQAQLLLADLVVVCVCPFLQRGRKTREVRDQGWFLVFHLESKHLAWILPPLKPSTNLTDFKRHQDRSLGCFKPSQNCSCHWGTACTKENIYKSCWKKMVHEAKDFLAWTGPWLGNRGMEIWQKRGRNTTYNVQSSFWDEEQQKCFQLAAGERRWYIANVCNSQDSVPKYNKNQG